MEKGFKPGFRTITRPSDHNTNEGSCIDNIFIKTNSMDTKPFKYCNLFNDHYPLFLSIKKIRHKNEKQNYQFINYSKLFKIAAKKTGQQCCQFTTLILLLTPLLN